MKKEEPAERLSIEGREIRITNPDKLYFSRETKVSKLDLVRYYLSVTPGALCGIRDRPIVLKRYVNGAESEAFFQKRAPIPRPDWLRTITLSFPSGRTAEEIVIDDAAGLAWIVNLGCIELHPHPVRSADLDHPDELRVATRAEFAHFSGECLKSGTRWRMTQSAANPSLSQIPCSAGKKQGIFEDFVHLPSLEVRNPPQPRAFFELRGVSRQRPSREFKFPAHAA